MQAHVDQKRVQGHVIALVPTMGSLHEGHLSLVRRAKAEADYVIVSIFVNPAQFGPNEDFADYPRDFEADCRLLEEVDGVGAVFVPDESTLYPEGVDQQRVWVTCPEMTVHLCGKYRPGHFEGVLTVVMKLFAACKPHIAVFGLKDIQQYILLQQLLQDLALDIRLVGEPIVRESSGLAHSSRNEYLAIHERRQAPILFRAVSMAAKMIEGGERAPISVTNLIRRVVSSAPNAKLQYAELVTASRLQPVEHLMPGERVIVGVAVYFRDIRLIDNAIVVVPEEQPRSR